MDKGYGGRDGARPGAFVRVVDRDDDTEPQPGAWLRWYGRLFIRRETSDLVIVMTAFTLSCVWLGWCVHQYIVRRRTATEWHIRHLAREEAHRALGELELHRRA